MDEYFYKKEHVFLTLLLPLIRPILHDCSTAFHVNGDILTFDSVSSWSEKVIVRQLTKVNMRNP